MLLFTACPPPPAIEQPMQPAKGSLADLSKRPWRHVGGDVTNARFARDKAKCGVVAQMAPVGAGTPEIKYLVTFFDCLRASGYEPDMNAPPSN